MGFANVRNRQLFHGECTRASSTRLRAFNAVVQLPEVISARADFPPSVKPPIVVSLPGRDSCTLWRLPRQARFAAVAH
jgi:hypothetical protein